jgi:ATP-dependent Zn protease
MATSAAGGGEDSDLARATGLAATAAASFGLDVNSGLLWFGVPDTASFFRLFRDQPTMAERVRAAIDSAYNDALALVQRRSAAVNALAVVLLEKRALDGGEASAIVAARSANAAAGVSS